MIGSLTRRLSPVFTEFVKVWGGLCALVVVGFIVTYRFVGASPPATLRIATGVEGGAYYDFASRYARLLARDGITLQVVPTAGSVENLQRLRSGDVSLALIQGGSTTTEDRNGLQALGSLFLEPLWVFTPISTTFTRLSQLQGRRVAVGSPGSGTHLLATRLLSATGITAGNTTFVENEVSEVGGLLMNDAVEAAFLVASAESSVIHDLAAKSALGLFDVERAAAYSRVFPFLRPVTVREGTLDLAVNVPSRDTEVVAAAAMLVARNDFHSEQIPALLSAARRVHEAGGVLEERDQFPSADVGGLQINDVARAYLRDGPSFLYRWLPYRTAVLIDRLKLLLLPFLALLIPLFRVAPPLYVWRIRSRIYRWYAMVRELDLSAGDSISAERAATLTEQLRALDREVSSVVVPLAYMGELYHVRLHIRFMQEKLEARVGV